MYSLTTDIGKLIRIYYENIELSGDDIREIYPGISRSSVDKLKKKAFNAMSEKKVLQWVPHKVNTECAYIAWGLDIADLERRYAKLQRLNRKE